MLILGISEIDNDAGAVLLKDGVLVGAANEERFTRVKQQAGVPLKTIEWLLKKAGAALSDVNHMYVVHQDVHSEYSHTLKKLDQTKWFSWPSSLTHKIRNYGVWRQLNVDQLS
jgi:predicted NodU family carbamoyl transferase